MSHSTVLVVIRDAENVTDAQAQLDELLEPFNENIDMEPYPKWLDDGDVQRAIEFYKKHPEFTGKADEPTPLDRIPPGDLDAFREWVRECVGAYNASTPEDGIYDADKNVYGYLSTYNPRSKWDWWVLGGRWHGFFQLKPGVNVGAEPMPEWRRRFGTVGDSVEGTDGMEVVSENHDAMLGLSGTGGDSPDEDFSGRADLARKGAIDFAAMRDLAGHKAEANYDKFERATAGIEVAPRWQDIVKLYLVEAGIDPELFPHDMDDDLRARHREAVDAARKAHHAHPWIQALRQEQLDPFFEDTHDYWCINDGGRTAFVERARNGATSTFAVLVDGEWHERGSMGWFGMVGDEKDASMWLREQARLVDSLPDDAWLAVIDVHI